MHIVQFNHPERDLYNRWYCCSTVGDAADGQHFYLAMGLLNGKVRVVKAHESFEKSCDDELTAHIELAYYYDFHGLDYPYDARLFELQRSDNPYSEPHQSKVMEFI